MFPSANIPFYSLKMLANSYVMTLQRIIRYYLLVLIEIKNNSKLSQMKGDNYEYWY